MNKNTIIILVLLSLVACDNKLEINAPYKEIPVVYGFIDKNEPYQYIRIQKVFQNSVDVNAVDAAKISDSLYLNNLRVQLYLTRYGGNSDTVINCSIINSIPKNAGFFANNVNYIYKSDYYNLNESTSSIRLIIKDTLTGMEYSSLNENKEPGGIPLIGDLKIAYNNFILDSTNTKKFKFTINVDKANYNASIIDAAIRFNYFEGTNLSNLTLKTYEYYIESGKPASSLLNGTNTSFIYSKTMLEDLRNHFNSEPKGLVRYFSSIDYVTWGAGSQIADLQEINKPNISFVQKNTDYSNIKNGLGIFSARTLNIQNNIPIVDSLTKDFIYKLPLFAKNP